MHPAIHRQQEGEGVMCWFGHRSVVVVNCTADWLSSWQTNITSHTARLAPIRMTHARSRCDSAKEPSWNSKEERTSQSGSQSASQPASQPINRRGAKLSLRLRVLIKKGHQFSPCASTSVSCYLTRCVLSPAASVFRVTSLKELCIILHLHSGVIQMARTFESNPWCRRLSQSKDWQHEQNTKCLSHSFAKTFRTCEGFVRSSFPWY